LLSQAQVVAEQKVWAAKLKRQEDEHVAVLKQNGLFTPNMEAGVHASDSFQHFVQLTYAIPDKIAEFIGENLVMAACPWCFHYIIDFDACCALKCSSFVCQKYCCAWCLRKCKDESECHDHVMNCPMNPRK
jgi:hypothetical protein